MWNVHELSDFLKGPNGVSRLYRVHQKSQSLKTSKLSPFLKDRVHEHYVIGLLVTKLKAGKDDSSTIQKALRDVFENRQIILLRKASDGKAPTRKRNLGRLPTVALVVLPDGDQSGMIASFTVFASTNELLAQSE